MSGLSARFGLWRKLLFLYQTEVLSPGCGFGDAKEFLDYVKNNDKSVDDDFTVIDYYI